MRTVVIATSVAALLLFGCVSPGSITPTSMPAEVPRHLKHLVGTLHSHGRIQRKLIHLYVTNPQGFHDVKATITAKIAHLRSVLHLSGCEEGFCEVNGICEPCAMTSAPSSDLNSLLGMVSTTETIDSALVGEYSKNSYAQVESTITADTNQMLQVLGLAQCEPDYCPINGYCDWCPNFLRELY